MVHTVELNWGKLLYHTPPPSPISQDAFCQMVCLYTYVWSHSDKIFEFTPFQARKGGFCPLRQKGPELGVVMVQCISYQEILVKETLQKTS